LTWPEVKTLDDAQKESSVPTGFEIGNKCPSYDVELVDGSGSVSIKDFAGKAVVLNFWGEWCGPCRNELPHFNELADEYSEDVVFLLVHSSFSAENTASYISQNFDGSKMIFAYDVLLSEYKDKYFSLCGGTDYYPRTLVLNRDGIITYAGDGALSYDALKAEIDGALNN